MALTHPLRARARVSGFTAVLLAFVVSGAYAQPAAVVSPELRKLVDAKAWQLDLQISFKASESGRQQSTAVWAQGPVDFQHAINVDYSETIMLDSRSAGASVSMQKLTANMADPAARASIQQTMMDIVMQTDNIGSWMPGGGMAALGDDPSEAQQKAFGEALVNNPIGKMTLDYSAQTRGDRLVNEMGSP